jgi:hypothetical protein
MVKLAMPPGMRSVQGGIRLRYVPQRRGRLALL